MATCGEGLYCDAIRNDSSAQFFGLTNRYSQAFGGFKGGEVLLFPFVASKNHSLRSYLKWLRYPNIPTV